MGSFPFAQTVGNSPVPLGLSLGGTGIEAASDLALLTGIGGLGLQATTGAAGYTLVNGTGNIITWTPPNDGNLHRFLVFLYMYVSSATTGGALGLNFYDPDFNLVQETLLSATQGAGSHGVTLGGYSLMVCRYNQIVEITQSSAMTAGAATAWAEIWGL